MTSKLDSLLHIKALPKYEGPILLGFSENIVVFSSRQLIQIKNLPLFQHLKNIGPFLFCQGFRSYLPILQRKIQKATFCQTHLLDDPPSNNPPLSQQTMAHFLHPVHLCCLLNTCLMPIQYPLRNPDCLYIAKIHQQIKSF